jgi:acetyltransferase
MSDRRVSHSFRQGLDSLLRPRSIAIVGASETGAWSKMIYGHLSEGGYAGAVHLINPRRERVFGQPCHPDFASLPESVEHAVVLVHADRVASSIEDGAKSGLKSALVFASGVGEGEEAEAPARAAALRDVLARYDVRLCGPNCLGTVSVRERAVLFPQASFRNLPAGSIGAVFQSGGILQFYLGSMAQRGAGFSYAVSSGNETDCDIADYINFLVEDPSTRTIILFIEGIRRAEAFRAACERALAARKPIVAMKIGRSARGKTQAISHTGALAGDDRVFDAFCRRYAIARCDTLDEMVEVSLGLDGSRAAKGSRLGFVVHSGGVKGILLDECERQNAVLAEIEPETIASVVPRVPPDIKVENPLDASIAGATDQNNLTEICIAFANDPNVDIIALNAVLPQGARKGSPDHYRRILAATDKPVIGCGRMRYAVEPGALDFQKQAGIPFLMGLPETVKVMTSLAAHGERTRRPLPAWPRVADGKAGLEAASLDATLAAYGIAVPRNGLAHNAAGAAALAADVGFPVALKLVSPDVVHKTEFGAVRIGLRNASEVAEAATAMTQAVQAKLPGARIEGFLVQEMVQGLEFIVGMRDDPSFGPCLVFGPGGVLVELMNNVETITLPLDGSELDAALARPQIARLLAGFRGAAPADKAALRRAISGLGNFYLAHRDFMREMEINPLVVRPEGQGAVAVDVRLVR